MAGRDAFEMWALVDEDIFEEDKQEAERKAFLESDSNVQVCFELKSGQLAYRSALREIGKNAGGRKVLTVSILEELGALRDNALTISELRKIVEAILNGFHYKITDEVTLSMISS